MCAVIWWRYGVCKSFIVNSFLSKKKIRFAQLSPPSQCVLQNLLCIKLSFIIKTKNQRGKNRVAVESDAYSFERALAFVSIHPWANRKWVVDQSERALYLCYLIIKY